MLLPLSTSMKFMAYSHGLRRTCPPGTRIARRPKSTGTSLQSQNYHTASRWSIPQKDSQGKDDLKPRSTEYSKSSSDDAAAATSETAFDPNQTKPETESRNADIESGDVRPPKSNDNNPLDMSPANRDVSKGRDPQEGGATKSDAENRKRTSGGGSAPKAGGGKYGGGS